MRKYRIAEGVMLGGDTEYTPEIQHSENAHWQSQLITFKTLEEAKQWIDRVKKKEVIKTNYIPC